jgi:hypothetical protein
MIHSLMFAETGVPVLGLFCEVNASILLSAYGAGLRGATAYWDQVYAQPRRRVDPIGSTCTACSKCCR